MDQPITTNQPKGKFHTFENNRKRSAGGPQFDGGEIALPSGSASFELQGTFAKAEEIGGKQVITRMWGRTKASPVGTAIRDRVAAEAARAAEKPRAAFIGQGDKPYLLESGQYVYFRNPQAGEAGKSGHPQTDMYGYWNPGAAYPIVKLGGWFGESEKGVGYFNGETQLPLPGKEDGVIPDADPSEHLEDFSQEPENGTAFDVEQDAAQTTRRGRRTRDESASR